MITEESARTWRTFIGARLLEKRQNADNGMSDWDYRKQVEAADAELESFLNAIGREDQEAAENEWWGLKNIANEWRTHPEFPEPISDGTMPCPVPNPDTGHPCTKPIHPGWTPSEGHGGGHFWKSPKLIELEEAGVHYDAGSLLAGKPTPYHLPENCAPGCWKWRDR
ncbi:hypothetical protein ACFCZR_24565 [Streptomyces rubiginosohelvolus]|uniref:hypothetical protein n=1 Tax=Streptomyces rubiginosohelvolus TaxID=67362 RepID=UPI0035DA7522